MTKTILPMFASSLAIAAVLAPPVYAQDAAPAPQPAPPSAPAASPPAATPANESVVVVRETRRGRVPGAPPAEVTYSSEDIAAFGASSLAELLADIQTITASRRGRVTGPPVILLNGRRVSGFRDIARLPPEAIAQVEVLPEEVALRFGFNADQRVINFILKDNFTSYLVEFAGRHASEGALTGGEFEVGYTRVRPTGRMSFQAEISPDGGVLEADRGVINAGRSLGTLAGAVRGVGVTGEIDPALSALAGRTVTTAGYVPSAGLPTLASFLAQANNPAPADQSGVRSLVPENTTMEVGGSYTTELSETTELTFNLRHVRTEDNSLLGYASFDALLPGPVAASPFTNDARVARLLDDPAVALVQRESTNGNTRFSATASGRWMDAWQWSVDAALEETKRRTVTRNELDSTAIGSAIASGSLNPFGPAAGFANFTRASRLTDDQTLVAEVISNTSGILTEALPAGPLRGSVRLSARDRQLESTSASGTDRFITRLSRGEQVALVSFDVPLTSKQEEFLPWLGTLSLTLGGTARELSDFGTLAGYETSLRWEFNDWLTLVLARSFGEGAPSIEQLGLAPDIQPNVPLLDVRTGQSVVATVTRGGNRLLRPSEQNDTSATVIFQLPKLGELTTQLDITWARNEVSDQIIDFPSPNTALEAAFPGRVTRDAQGRLTALDTRPINIFQTESEQVRWSLNLSGEIPIPARFASMTSGFPGGAGGGARPPGASGPPGAAGAPGAGAAAAGGPPRTGAGGPPASAGAPPSAGGRPAAATGAPGGAPASAPTGGPPTAGGPPGAGGPQAAGGPPGGMPRIPGMGGGGPPRPRWNVTVTHTMLLDQQVLLAPGLAPLRPLDGDSLSGRTGVAEHTVNVSGGAFVGFLGFRTDATWTGESEVVTPTTTLFFDDRLVWNLRLFMQLDERIFPFVRGNDFLKNSRVFIRADNVTNSTPRVRDSLGNTPLAYQPALLDPIGRSVEIGFRKVW